MDADTAWLMSNNELLCKVCHEMKWLVKTNDELRRMNFNEVNEIDDFDLYAAPEGDADELEAQPVPNVVAEHSQWC